MAKALVKVKVLVQAVLATVVLKNNFRASLVNTLGEFY